MLKDNKLISEKINVQPILKGRTFFVIAKII